MNKAYDKVTWQNAPSTASPLNATNLNKMSDALDTIDDRVITLDGQASSASSALAALQEGKVDKVAGKGLSTNDYTTTEKTKLAGISAEANKVEITPVVTEGTTLATISIDGVDTAIKGSDIDVDSAMSPTSENPVQNKVIYEALNNILPEETAEGNPISITDASGLNAKSCEVTFSPIQSGSGDPSPDNVRPISGRDSLVLNQPQNKNLFGDYTSQSGMDINSSGEIVSGANYNVYKLRVTNKQYILSFLDSATSSGYHARILARDKNDTDYSPVFVRQVTYNATTDKLTLSVDLSTLTDVGYIYVALRKSTSNIQLEYGTTATDYIAYSSVTHTATFPDTVYGGVWKATEGKAVIDKVVVDLSTLSWTEATVGNYTVYRAVISDKQGGTVANDICENYLVGGANRNYLEGGNNRISIWNSAEDTRTICLRDDNITINTITTVLSGVKYCYKLATPTEITLTPETIELLKGNNVLWTDGDNVKLVYSADIKSYIAEQLSSLS